MAAAKYIICLFFIVIAIARGRAAQGECPDGWVDGGNVMSDNCYFFSNRMNVLKWEDARQYCLGQNADMVSFESKDEVAFLQGQFRALSNYIWYFGYTKEGNTWGFVDKTPVLPGVLYQWYPGHPSTVTGYKYTYIYYSYMISDYGTIGRRFICKLKKSKISLCDKDSGWSHIGNNCYHMETTPRKWADARKVCQLENADLSVILDQKVSTGIKQLASKSGKDVWIGLKTYVTNTTTNTYEYRFWNGSKIIYKEWSGTSEPKPESGQEGNSCVFSAQGSVNTWKIDTCDTAKSFVCQKPEGRCHPGWYQFRDQCFLPGLTRKAFIDAHSFCQQMNAELINIKSNDTQLFINSYLPNFSQLGYEFMWIGARQIKPDGPLMWTQGGEVNKSYVNWAKKEPKLDNSKSDCAHIVTSSTSGQWAISDDCIEEDAFICQIDIHKSPEKVTTPEPKFSCDKGWTLYENNCYRVNTTRQVWIKAQKACRDNNADLADIQSVREQTFVNTLIQSSTWIGLNNRKDHTKFVWNDNTSPLETGDYKNWFPRRPCTTQTCTTNCVVVYVYYSSYPKYWYDRSCTEYYNSICKKPANRNGVTPKPRPTLYTARWSEKCGVINWESNPLSDYCYLFITEPLSWSNARDYCRAHGGEIASINSQQEKSFLAGRISSLNQDGFGFWIGLSTSSSRWYWSDKSSVNYLNWAEGRPKSSYIVCAMMSSANFQWYDEKCSLRYGFVCKMVGKNVTKTTLPPKTTVKVPDGHVLGCPDKHVYYSYLDACYGAFKDSVDFNTAQRACRKYGGDLASIRSYSENSAVVSRAKSVIGYHRTLLAWIGLVDSLNGQSTKLYRWTDGTKMTYSSWSSWEPSLNTGKDCVTISTYIQNWSTRSCTYQANGYVCKSPRIPVLKPATKAPLVGCPSQAYDLTYNGYCYKFIKSTTAVTWQSARNTCKRYSGDLTTIRNSAEQAFLSGTLSNYGLNDGDVWFGLQKVGYYFRWVDGSIARYTNWIANRNLAGVYGFLKTNSTHLGLWNLGYSTKVIKNLICNVRQNIPTTTPIPTTMDPNKCASGWIDGGDLFCYKGFYQRYQRSKKTWTEARSACLEMQGDLASLHNDTISALLRRHIPTYPINMGFWIGLNTRDENRGHVWSDGQALNWINWADGQPNNHNNAQECVLINNSNLKWSDEVCNAAHSWVCKVRRGVLPSGTPPPTTPAPILPDCGRGYSYYNGYCYKLSLFSRSWEDARTGCMREGAQLVSITSQDENDFLLRQLNKQYYSTAWIGLEELGVNSAWKWTDKTPYTFFNWDVNQPNDGSGAQHCASMSQNNGFWSDTHCATRMPYFCKRQNDTNPLTDPPPTKAAGFCPERWHAMGNKCVRVYGSTTDKVTWNEAKDQCFKIGNITNRRTYLVSISDKWEQSALTYIIKSSKVKLWTGLQYTYRIGSNWLDNSKVTYTNWDKTAYRYYPCGMLSNEGYRPGKWFSASCSQKYGYICMQYKDPALTQPWPSPGIRNCPNGWVAYMDSCYWYESKMTGWSDALKNCQAKKSELVSMHDEFEHSFVSSMMHDIDTGNTEVWIGLNDLITRGRFVWSDKWPVQFTTWAYRQPNSVDNKRCVWMKSQDSRFSTASCFEARPSICKITNGKPPAPTPGIEGGCLNKNWYPYGSHCYYVETGTSYRSRLSWGKARSFCKGMNNADLVSVDDQGVQDFINRKLNELTQINYYIYDVWLGLQTDGGGGFEWSDKTPLKYTNWAPGEPNNVNTTREEDCVQMHFARGAGKWSDVTCTKTLGYICKLAKIPDYTLPPTTTSPPVTQEPPITDKNRQTKQTVGTQPPAREKQRGFFSSNKNDGMIVGLILSLIVVMVCVSALLIWKRRGNLNISNKLNTNSSSDNVMENVAYVRSEGNINLTEQTSGLQKIDIQPNINSNE